MDTEATTPTQVTQDKQITVAVPEDRVAEFYAFYGRFLAGRQGRRGRGPGGHGHGHGRGPGQGHRCGGRHEAEEGRQPTTSV